MGMAPHGGRAGTPALPMGTAAQAPSMPDCDGCGDAAARMACDLGCVPAFAALLPAEAASPAWLPLAAAVASPARLVGRADPPDPHPPRPVARR